MADKTPNSTEPQSNYHFRVKLGELGDVPFQEISGLQIEAQAIQYRDSESPRFSPTKTAKTNKVAYITLKKGILNKDKPFWDWYTTIQMNTAKPETVVIRSLDEAGKVAMSWTLKNAKPTKIQSPDLKADGNEIAIETLELAHEGLEIRQV